MLANILTDYFVWCGGVVGASVSGESKFIFGTNEGVTAMLGLSGVVASD